MAKNTDNYTKLSRFFGSEYNALKHYIRSRIADSADRDAEDLLQDVAYSLFMRVDQLTPIHNIAGFVYRSVRNRIIDTMRSRKERITMDEDVEEKLAGLADQYLGDAAFTDRDELYNHLKEALVKLKPEYLAVILAIDFENQSYREISANTGIPQGTLMSRRHRALSQLSKALENSVTIKNE